MYLVSVHLVRGPLLCWHLTTYLVGLGFWASVKTKMERVPLKKSCYIIMFQFVLVSWGCRDKLPQTSDFKHWKLKNRVAI